MESLIITSGHRGNFGQLKNFVGSLRDYGEYSGEIVICDNAISGSWDNPGTWSNGISFTKEQQDQFKRFGVKIYSFENLIESNSVDPTVVKRIKSPTQRYPYKFIYNTLISKTYLDKVESVFYLDSDIFFQLPVSPLFQSIESGKITIVKEWKRMKDNRYLSNWLRYSDFSSLSCQRNYLDKMLSAENFCSGLYGGRIEDFHRFNLLAMLLSSNQFVDFYSDQPLVNILKSFFGLPFNEAGFEYCLHLGELDRGTYIIKNDKFIYDGITPICVHFNSGKYDELEAVLENREFSTPTISTSSRLIKKVASLFKKN